MRGLVVLVALAGCARGPELTPVAPQPDSSAVAAAVSVDGLVRETFEVGPSAETPLADYLFVVDGSPSTKSVVDRLRAGFAALAAEAPFPERARIAVVSTIPGDPGRLDTAHPKVDKRSDARFTPGFLAPVDRRSIQRWKGLGLPGFDHAGCDAWFGPRDVDEGGVPCILAHTETSKKHGPIEAGLTVVSQMLGKGSVFRDGAAVNVVFVSDTHDPGLAPYKKNGRRNKKFDPSLVENRPTWEQLRDRAAATHSLASFRHHAIAPETECVELWWELGPAYYDAANASGGEILDICTAEAPDYVRFVREIAARGDALDRPVLALGDETDDVVSVEIDGEPVPWTWGDGRAILLTAQPGAKARVDVIYRPSPGTSEVPPDEAVAPVQASEPPGPKVVDRSVLLRPKAAVHLEVEPLRLIAGADYPGDDDHHELVVDPSTGRCASTDVYDGESETVEGACRVAAVDGAWTAYAFDTEDGVEIVQIARFADLPEAERADWQALTDAQDIEEKGWVVAGGGLDRVYLTP
jgi:hypothetical protein